MSRAYLLLLFCAFLTSTHSSIKAFVTYHEYQPSTPITTLACSDGKNGLLNWNYTTLAPLYPYVTSWQSIVWNSPNCGICLNMTYQKKSIFVTVVDGCGKYKDSTAEHFDMGPDAFKQLFGKEGISKGSMMASYDVVQASHCKGNKKNGTNTTNSTSQAATQDTSTSAGAVQGDQAATKNDAKGVNGQEGAQQKDVKQVAVEINTNAQVQPKANLKTDQPQNTGAFGRNPFAQSFNIIGVPSTWSKP